MAEIFGLMAPKDLSPLITDLKMASPGDNRDAGFCSGEDEDLDVDHADTDADNSPTDVSEDSVDVKVHVIGGITQKRKLTARSDSNPKRTKQEDSKTRSPFRPWSHETPRPHIPAPPLVPCGYTPPLCRPIEQAEPLSLVVKTRDRIYKPKYAGRLRASPEPIKAEPISPTSEPISPLLRPPELTAVPRESLLGHVAYPMHLVPPIGQDRIPVWPPRATPKEPISRDLNPVFPAESIPSPNVIRSPSETVTIDATSSRSPGYVSAEPVVRCSVLRPPSVSEDRVPRPESLLRPNGLKREPSPSHGPPKLRIKMEQRDTDDRLSRVPEDSCGRFAVPEDPSGRFAVPEDPSGRFAVPEDPSGRFSVPEDPSGRFAVPEDPSGRFAVPEDPSGRFSVPESGDLNPAYREVTVKEEPEEEPREGRRKSSQQQRNYKNMTRERRMEANARERTRVHTISAAFETLRHAVPAYSHNQKLSKLSVLRIACSYIMTLSRIAGLDYSADQSEPSVASCVENVSRTIQMEGKLRKKKDEH
nr:PREDICTED: proline-rich extensin-like protein EPR1 [Bemisia tabaci]